MQTQQEELTPAERARLERHMARLQQASSSICATVPLDSPFAEILVNDDIRRELLASFFDIQDVPGFRDWQWAYVNRPFTQQVGAVLQMPPGAGKTLVAQWIIIESLLIFPTKRVIFAVPLRVLAKQVRDDVGRVLAMLNDFIRALPPEISYRGQPLAYYLPKRPGRGAWEEIAGFSADLAEGPGAKVNMQFSNVLVATYEHAAGELRKDPRATAPGARPIHVGLVIVDEVHNIAKGDSRSVVIDDIFFFANARFVYSNTAGKIRERVRAAAEGGEVSEEVKDFVYKLPRVIGMSGTLEDWTSKRLLEAYPRPQTNPRFAVPPQFHQILTTEELEAEFLAATGQQPQTQTQTQPRGRGPARVMLDKNRFSVQATVCFAADMVKALLQERIRNANNPEYRPRRLVVFMSTVAEAEMAYVHLLADPDIANTALAAARTAEGAADAFAAPRITLVNTIEQLSQRFETEAAKKKGYSFNAKGIGRVAGPFAAKLQDEEKAPPADTESATTTAAAYLLESTGIYIHHAQIAQPEIENDGTVAPKKWSDVVQEQLVKDFVAVFSTSTISVGVNLASTMLGILGPNTMWTVDQAEQMIGRVGRVNEDAAASAVAVVDSAYYHLPPPVSMTLPNEWFVPRLTTLLMFSSGWAQRMAAPAQEAATHMIEDAIDVDEGESAEAAEAGLIRRVQSNSTIEVTAWQNADVRGFFSPSGAADISLTDEPGNGVARIALDWRLIDEHGMVTPECVAALELCKQDMKSLPATLHLVVSQFSRDSPLPKEEQDESWKVVLLWAMLMTRLPAMWFKWMEAPKGEGAAALRKIQLITKNTGDLFFRTKGVKADALGMLALYGKAHQQYEGQQEVPGAANAPRVLDFATLFAWALGLFNREWPTKRPVDMCTYALDVMGFLDTTIQDAQALTTIAAHLNLNHTQLTTALGKARSFLFVALFPYTTDRPDIDVLRTLNRDLNLALSIATPAVISFLVLPSEVGAYLTMQNLIDAYRETLLSMYKATGFKGPAYLALKGHIKGVMLEGVLVHQKPLPLEPKPGGLRRPQRSFDSFGSFGSLNALSSPGRR